MAAGGTIEVWLKSDGIYPVMWQVEDRLDAAQATADERAVVETVIAGALRTQWSRTTVTLSWREGGLDRIWEAVRAVEEHRAVEKCRV